MIELSSNSASRQVKPQVSGVVCCWARGLTPPAQEEVGVGAVVLVVINFGTGTSDLPLRERPRGVPVGYGAPATIVVTVIVPFVVR